MAPIFKSISLACLILLAPLTTMAAPVERRQLGGEGAACNSILSGTDNAVGFGVANALENTAGTVNGVKAHVKRGALARRQGNKIADGAVPLLNALGLPQIAQYEDQNGDYIDTISTDDAAEIGAQIGQEEQTSIEGAGALVPRK